jgi:CBS domain-containing membrane protein
VRTLEFATPLATAWAIMVRHEVRALPVLNPARRVIGIVTRGDFLRHGNIHDYATMAERLRRFLQATPTSHSDKPEVVGQIMTSKVVTAAAGMPITALVPLMGNSSKHHVPVLDAERRFAGIVTQSDLLAALVEARLD